jgi:hypothetical protein
MVYLDDYTILGFQTKDTEHGCDAERFAETIKDARAQARYMLTDDYRRASEAIDVLAIVQIWRDDVLIDEIHAEPKLTAKQIRERDYWESRPGMAVNGLN